MNFNLASLYNRSPGELRFNSEREIKFTMHVPMTLHEPIPQELDPLPADFQLPNNPFFQDYSQNNSPNNEIQLAEQDILINNFLNNNLINIDNN
jgi:hypothetical protein